jgi:hypothetical protein
MKRTSKDIKKLRASVLYQKKLRDISLLEIVLGSQLLSPGANILGNIAIFDYPNIKNPAHEIRKR